MCGKNHVRYISSITVVVFIFIGLCGFALASASSTVPVPRTTPISKPTNSTPTRSKPVSGVKTGVIPAPIITSISPTKGRQDDGVTLNGSNFGSVQGSSYVSFGTFKATVCSSWSDTCIGTHVPKITGVTFPMTGPVTVETANGKSNAVSFTALGPVPKVSSVSPPACVDNTPVVLTITGAGFQTGAKIYLEAAVANLINLQVDNVVVKSSTKITCRVTIPTDVWMVEMSFDIPRWKAHVTNPDGGQASGGLLVDLGKNPCGAGAITPIVGFGLVMGIMTLAGTVRARRRREKKS